MNRPVRMAALLALTALPVARAQNVPVEKYKLANGMTVILHEDHARPVGAVNIWYRVGAKDEPARRSGFAHLFEHLMFMGTERVPNGGFDRIMEAEGGSNNASTGSDRTNYYSSGPSNILPTLLWLDADRLEDLARAMDQPKLDLQRDVVLNELRQTVENSPYGRADVNIQYLMFPPSHPYHFPPIGTEEDLKAATVADVKDFFATFYHPGNASLVVAGDFDPAVIKPLIADLFATLPRRPEPMRKAAESPRLDGVKRGTMYDKVQLPMVTFCYHSPPAYADGDAESDLISSILASGKSSRLYKRLVAEDKLATSVTPSRDLGKLGSQFRVDVIARPGADLDRVEAVVDEEIARLTAAGPTAPELEQVKAQVELRKAEAFQSIEARADTLNEYEFYYGNPNSFQRDIDRYRAVTADSIKRWCTLVLTPNARVLYRTLPVAPQRGPNARDTRPTDAKPGPFAPPAPSIATLSSGVPLWVWELPGAPLESVQVVFVPDGALSAADGSDAGLPSLTAQMMAEGAGDLDAFAFAQAVEALGGSFDSGTDHEALSVELTVLARNFDRATLLLSDALRRPRFQADDFERVKKLALDALRQSDDNPRQVAARVASKALYGAGHPLAWPVTGTPASVSRVQLADVQRMYQRLVVPRYATIVAAGSLSAADVQNRLEKALADWRSDPSGAPFAAITPPLRSPQRVFVVDRPDAVQTVVQFFAPGVPHSSELRLPLSLVNTTLGASFTSRLNQNLREKHGYTYGARSGFDFSRHSGTFTAGAGVTTAVTGKSLSEFLGEFARLKSGDIDEFETSKARTFHREGLVERFQSTRSVAALGAALVEDGAPFQTVIDDAARADGVSAAQLNSVARQFPWQEGGVLVLVGDKRTILEQLKGTGLPAPTEVNPYGDPLPSATASATAEK